MASHRRFFSVDEALSALLLEDEVKFTGSTEDSSSDGDSATHDEEDLVVSENYSDDDEVFLPRAVDPAVAAANFLEAENPNNAQAATLAEHGIADAPNPDVAAAAPVELNCCNLKCIQKFDSGDIEGNVLNMRDLERSEFDLVILSKLDACRYARVHTDDPGKRRRQKYQYSFQGAPVCVTAFRHVYDVSDRRLKNLRKHLEDNGVLCTSSRQCQEEAT